MSFVSLKNTIPLITSVINKMCCTICNDYTHWDYYFWWLVVKIPVHCWNNSIKGLGGDEAFASPGFLSLPIVQQFL